MRGDGRRGFFALLPDARGTGTKGRLQGTIVGRLVTVPGSGQADRAPCVCAWSGWALQPHFPCWLLLPACGLLSGPPPHWPINPLLPTAYLALWLGHPCRALVCISHAGERQAPSRSRARACMISLASLRREALARGRPRGDLCSPRKGFRPSWRAVRAGLPASGAHQRLRRFAMQGLCMSGNNEKPKTAKTKEGPRSWCLRLVF